MSAAVDWPALLPAVARELLGEPPGGEAGAGGGVVDLVQRELATDRLPRRPAPPRNPPDSPESRPAPARESKTAADHRSDGDAQAVQRARGEQRC